MNLWVWFIWWQKCANRRKISLIRKHLTFDAAQLLDQALVTSKLGCCNLLLYGLPKVVIKHLQRVQNAAAGVTLSPKFCHNTPVLANLPWLPTDLRIDFKILIVTYYSLHGLAPAYIQDLLQSYLSARDLRSSKKNLLSAPAFNMDSYCRRVFAVAAPRSLEQSSSSYKGCWMRVWMGGSTCR